MVSVGLGRDLGVAICWEDTRLAGGGTWKRSGQGASRTPVGTLVVPLAHCVAVGELFDFSGLRTKKKDTLYIREVTWDHVCESPCSPGDVAPLLFCSWRSRFSRHCQA